MAASPASTARPDVIVVGGGVIGLSIAEELARRDKRVTVFERRRPGGEASWAAGGMLAAEYEFDREGPLQRLAFHSRSAWNDYAARLERDYATSVRLRSEGALAIARTDAELAALHARLDGRSFGGRVEWLSPSAVREKEPALAPGVRGAAWLRDDHVCENRALLFALLRAARKLGVEIRSDAPAKLLVENGRARGVIANGGRVEAPLVVNAAGAWASIAAKDVPGHPSLFPVRGQMLGLHAEPADALRHVVRWDGGYAIPRSGARIVAGSTTEPEAGFTKGVTDAARERITAELRATLPGLAAEIRHAWSGLRPASEDGLPILGALPGVEGYLLACGHYRNGILLTPVTASAIADLAEGKRPAVALDAFSPARASLANATSVVVNGAARVLKAGTTVRGLLSELSLERPGVAVAVNEEVIRRGDWDRTVLTRNDRVEIIHAVGGG